MKERIVKAVIFDQDGLMFDTERVSAKAWGMAGAEFHMHLEESFLKTIRGTNYEDAKKRFLAAFGNQVDFDRFRARKNEYYEKMLREQGVPVKPGLKELLSYLKEQGCPAAVGSASRLSYTERNLEETGIRTYFDCLVTGDMVSRAKPDPEIFLKAAVLLGEKPQHCLVLEDSLNGVEAGLAGGFVTVMVPDLTQPDENLKKRVYRVCDSLLDVLEFFKKGEL